MMEQHKAELIAAIQQFNVNDYDEIFEALFKVLDRRGEIFLVGNESSFATVNHIANDLAELISKRIGKHIKMRCLSAATPRVVTTMEDFIFPGDALVAFSGSGNSPNILKIVEEANAKSCVTIGFCGCDGGRLARIASLSLIVPSYNMRVIEDILLMTGYNLVFDLIHKFQT
jgi:D-sedoheptulose 7-phosphate isomerase